MKKHVHKICGKANQTRQFWQRNLVACKPKTNYNVITLLYDQLWNTQVRYGIQLVIINLQNKLNQYKEKLQSGLQTTEIMTSALDKSQKNYSCKAFLNNKN